MTATSGTRWRSRASCSCSSSWKLRTNLPPQFHASRTVLSYIVVLLSHNIQSYIFHDLPAPLKYVHLQPRAVHVPRRGVQVDLHRINRYAIRPTSFTSRSPTGATSYARCQHRSVFTIEQATHASGAPAAFALWTPIQIEYQSLVYSSALAADKNYVSVSRFGISAARRCPSATQCSFDTVPLVWHATRSVLSGCSCGASTVPTSPLGVP